jgi:hypothetical protein
MEAMVIEPSEELSPQDLLDLEDFAAAFGALARHFRARNPAEPAPELDKPIDTEG